MGATTVTTRAGKGSALTHTEMDTNLTNLNNVGTYLGSVMGWLTATPPDATWLECNGSSLTTAGYPSLFAVIGYTFGGSGANFNIPDFRGQFLRGWDHGAGVDTGAAARTNRGDGTTGDAVGTKQDDAFETHIHNVAISTGNFSSVGGSGPIPFGSATNFNVASQATGGTETRPKNINVMWIIKAKLV